MNRLVIIFIAIIILAGFFFLRGVSSTRQPVPAEKSSEERPAESFLYQENDMVELATPLPNTVVQSPLSLSGRARGNWFFEASFSMRIEDANGTNLGIGVMQAQSEWMTTDFVPFKGTIMFIAPTTATGKLILKKDNPSGLPEHDAQMEIPIRFK